MNNVQENLIEIILINNALFNNAYENQSSMFWTIIINNKTVGCIINAHLFSTLLGRLKLYITENNIKSPVLTLLYDNDLNDKIKRDLDNKLINLVSLIEKL